MCYSLVFNGTLPSADLEEKETVVSDENTGNVTCVLETLGSETDTGVDVGVLGSVLEDDTLGGRGFGW